MNTPSSSDSKRFLAAMAVVACAGICLRAASLCGELWLDEIWSLLLVRSARTPVEIAQVRHDNNHLLNSMWMWFLGPSSPAWMHRIPSLLFSSLMIIGTCAALKREQSPWLERWLVWFTILCSFSYLLVLYGSEARGYSLAVLCAVWAAREIDTLLVSPSRAAAWRFAGVSSLGCLSHAVFALFLGPAVGWFLYGLIVHPARGPSRNLIRIAIIPPIIVGLVMTAIFYGRLEIGGGPIQPYAQVALSTLSVAFGGEELSIFAIPRSAWWSLAAFTILCICLVELAHWRKEGDTRAALAAFVLIAPVVAVCLTHPPFLLGRYFIIQILVLYLLFARFLARLARRGTAGRLIASLAAIAFVGLNCLHSAALVSRRRAHYGEAVKMMAKSSAPDERITLGGDQDFQNRLRLEYLRLVLPEAQRVDYVPDYRSSGTFPTFIVRESLDPLVPVSPSFELGGARYTLEHTYPAPPFAGSWWYVYRKST